MGIKRRIRRKRKRIMEFSDNSAHLHTKKYRLHHREINGWVERFDCDYKSVYVETGDVDEDGDMAITEKKYGIDKRKYRLTSSDYNDEWKDGE